MSFFNENLYVLFKCCLMQMENKIHSGDEESKKKIFTLVFKMQFSHFALIKNYMNYNIFKRNSHIK